MNLVCKDKSTSQALYIYSSSNCLMKTTTQQTKNHIFTNNSLHSCFVAMTNVLVFVFCAIISLVVAPDSVSAQPTRAFFVFGDSLVDSGNNDFLATTARADAPPYGIDFPSHRPTGRFSNGLNIPDLISMN